MIQTEKTKICKDSQECLFGEVFSISGSVDFGISGTISSFNRTVYDVILAGRECLIVAECWDSCGKRTKTPITFAEIISNNSVTRNDKRDLKRKTPLLLNICGHNGATLSQWVILTKTVEFSNEKVKKKQVKNSQNSSFLKRIWSTSPCRKTVLISKGKEKCQKVEFQVAAILARVNDSISTHFCFRSNLQKKNESGLTRFLNYRTRKIEFLSSHENSSLFLEITFFFIEKGFFNE